jgi:hypothetical protein
LPRLHGKFILMPRTGDLLMIHEEALYRVTPQGQVHLELGKPRQHILDASPITAARLAELDGYPIAPGTPCLSRPVALQEYGGRVFLADAGLAALLVYDPATRVLRVLAGDPQQDDFHPGPVRAFSSLLPPSQCGALGHPTALAISAQGQCLVGLGGEDPQRLAEVDLGPLSHGTQSTGTIGQTP